MAFFEKFIRIVSPTVLFFLMFCFAATIHPKQFAEKLKSRGIVIGVLLQLIVMPFVGFLLLKLIPLPGPSQIVFMVLLSSPGGAFSNFLISIFNGDLALSVAMTTVSTMFSIPFLPFNLFFYLDVLGSEDETGGAAASIDYEVLGRIVVILVSGVGIGLLANRRVKHREKLFYKIANISAILQTLLGVLASNNDSPFYEKPADLFLITFIAVIVALLLAIVATLAARMKKEETFSAVVEVAVQNSSVSVAFAAAAFQGAELSESISIPVLHGIFTTFTTLLFAIWAYNMGWTYSPKDGTFFTAMSGYYQPSYVEGVGTRRSSAASMAKEEHLEMNKPKKAKADESEAPDEKVEEKVEEKATEDIEGAVKKDTYEYVV